MKKTLLFVLLVLCCTYPILAQNGRGRAQSSNSLRSQLGQTPDSTKASTKNARPRMMHYTSAAYYPVYDSTTSAENKPTSSESDFGFVSYSLVSPEFYDNWEEEVSKARKMFVDQKVLIAVSKTDSQQRSRFITEFYKELISDSDFLAAYTRALRSIQLKYDALDFKHAILIDQ